MHDVSVGGFVGGCYGYLYFLNLDLLQRTIERDYKLQPQLANATLAPYGHVLQRQWTDRCGETMETTKSITVGTPKADRLLTLSSGDVSKLNHPSGPLMESFHGFTSRYHPTS